MGVAEDVGPVDLGALMCGMSIKTEAAESKVRFDKHVRYNLWSM